MRPYFLPLALAGTIACISTPSMAAKPTVKQALQLRPVQTDIAYEMPADDEVKDSTVESAKESAAGWIVRGPSSQLLRRFLDTNRDNKIDRWCYYDNGVEVYRDIDSNFNGKADEYRWLGPAGSKWGLDSNEDGKIDRWKMISPEEATAEVIHALSEGDEARFRRILLTASDISTLGLGDAMRDDLQKRITAAKEGFNSLSDTQSMVKSDSKWIQFAASKPGVIPAATDGSTKDLLVYDNVAAIVETDSKHDQVAIGTLIRVGEGWRVIDLPKSEASIGFFYASIDRSHEVIESVEGQVNEAVQKLLPKLEELDDQLANATTPDELAKMNRERADVIRDIVRATPAGEERRTWTRQLIDAISAAVQAGQYPEGIARLRSINAQLAKDPGAKELLPYAQFLYMTADYSQKLQKPNADFTKVQSQWLKDLATFVKRYPKAEQASEAMLQLAIAHEFAGNEKEAGTWYAKIVTQFPSTTLAAKAAGAKKRIESVGKSISFQGQTVDGRQLSLASLRGKVVLIHYWATWCEPCKQDLKTIKSLQAKFGSQGFVPLGANVDNEQSAFTTYLKSNPLGWTQLFGEGGLDSKLANQLGILTLPTMLLIDKSGRVVRKNIHSAELEAEIGKLLQ